MWGLECSKAEDEWGMDHIAERQLELAQLNQSIKKLAIAFEEKLQESVVNGQSVPSKKERMLLFRMLNRFRSSFADGVEIAKVETGTAGKEMGYDLVTDVVGGLLRRLEKCW